MDILIFVIGLCYATQYQRSIHFTQIWSSKYGLHLLLQVRTQNQKVKSQRPKGLKKIKEICIKKFVLDSSRKSTFVFHEKQYGLAIFMLKQNYYKKLD